MSASINMTSCFRDPQSLLATSFVERNLKDFRYALDTLNANPNLIDRKAKRTLFNAILQTPDSSDFIALCIQHGADCYTKDSLGKYPIFLCAESLCSKNLKTFLRTYDSSKVNVMWGDRNVLHCLLEVISDSDNGKVSDCIKVLLDAGVNCNQPNEKSETPFFLLLKEQKKDPQLKELTNYILDNFDVDFHTYRAVKLQKFFKDLYPERTIPPKTHETINVDVMRNLLDNHKESEFLAKFTAFQSSASGKGENGTGGVTENDTNLMKENYCLLLNVAAKTGCALAVDRLLQENVDVNKISKDQLEKKPPAFVACSYGYFRILELLLTKPELITFCPTTRRSLLHEVCIQLGTREINEKCNYLECLDLLLDDERCLKEINATDDIGCTALHYTINNRCHEATKKLLNKFAFIGTQNNFGELAISNISHTVLEEVLDNCIAVKNCRDSEKVEIEINYNLLKSPKYEKEQQDQEIAPLNYIDECPDLRYLIKHPVLSSFLYLKWQKLSLLFFLNLIVFTIFLISFMIFVVFCDAAIDSKTHQKIENGTVYYLLYLISLIGIAIITLRELLQFLFSCRSYISSLVNWCEVLFVILAWTVLLSSGMSEDFRRITRALVILLAAGEFLLLVGRLPYFSISTYMVILSQVWKTFWQSFALYCIPVIAFAMSFYSLFGGAKSKNDAEANGKEENSDDEAEATFNRFGYPGISIIKTIVMLTGEFEAASLDLDGHGTFYCLIFLLFVFMITIVLFNLLNALAVSDTQIIKSDAELADLSQRIKVLNRYETIIFNRRNENCCLNDFCNQQWMKRYVSIFDSVIPSGIITIKPHSDNEIYTMIPKKPSDGKTKDVGDEEERQLYENQDCNMINIALKSLMKFSTMDKKIMKKIHVVLDERRHREDEQEEKNKLMRRIEAIENQFRMLFDLINK